MKPAALTMNIFVIPLLVAIAVYGWLLGSELGARRIPPVQLRKILGLVPPIVGLKMIATA
jgi:uncharacterized membrane protein YfcA